MTETVNPQEIPAYLSEMLNDPDYEGKVTAGDLAATLETHPAEILEAIGEVDTLDIVSRPGSPADYEIQFRYPLPQGRFRIVFGNIVRSAFSTEDQARQNISRHDSPGVSIQELYRNPTNGLIAARTI